MTILFLLRLALVDWLMVDGCLCCHCLGLSNVCMLFGFASLTGGPDWADSPDADVKWLQVPPLPPRLLRVDDLARHLSTLGIAALCKPPGMFALWLSPPYHTVFAFSTSWDHTFLHWCMHGVSSNWKWHNLRWNHAGWCWGHGGQQAR